MQCSLMDPPHSKTFVSHLRQDHHFLPILKWIECSVLVLSPHNIKRLKVTLKSNHSESVNKALLGSDVLQLKI